MKTTIITLLALAGVAAAETITINPLTDATTDWKYGKARNKGSNVTWNSSAGTMTATNVQWAGSYAEYTLDKAITLQNPEDTMTVTFTMLSSRATGPYGGNDWGVCMTTTLIGADKALTAGYGRYDQGIIIPGNDQTDAWKGHADGTGPIQMAVSDNVDGKFFNMKETVGSDAPLTNYTEATGVLQNNVALTLTNTIKWDASTSQFVATITYGDNDTVLGTANLGETFNLKKINLSVDTGQMYENNVLTAQISNLTITANLVPEPSTATLSLLALAGLAARRRRK